MLRKTIHAALNAVLRAAPPGTPQMQFIRYAIAGGLTFLVDFFVYALLLAAGAHYLAATVPAFVAGVSFNYVLATTWVFQQRRLSSRTQEFVVFASLGIAALGLGAMLLWICVEFLGMAPLAGKLLSTVAVLFFNFGARRRLLFSI